jgi:hypothetical protein
LLTAGAAGLAAVALLYGAIAYMAAAGRRDREEQTG